jgi:PqqD family protein of HPr-rel-A system
MQRTWGDETVVYDPLAGSTHLLDPVAVAVLDALSVGCGSVTSITQSLLTEFEADSEADVLAAVQVALAKLRDIGLVQSSTE